MNHNLITSVLLELGQKICDQVHDAVSKQSVDELTQIHKEEAEDTIYQIDRDVEDVIVDVVGGFAHEMGGVVLVAEGVGEEGNFPVLPHGTKEEDAAVRILIDPIDGTRCIMYDKRSAYFLAGAAPNRMEENCLQDIEAAVMVELPPSRSYLSDSFCAIRGNGALRYTRNLHDRTIRKRAITPAKANSILGGFAQISRFFTEGKGILASLEEELIYTLFPNMPEKRANLFEDQYISTGGQLAEMLVGHDRFIADIRAGLFRRLEREGKRTGLTGHPYDVSALLIGTEAGIEITDLYGNPLNAPMDTTSSVDWIAYANKAIRSEVEPVFQKLMKKYEII